MTDSSNHMPEQEMTTFSTFNVPLSWNNLQYTVGTRQILCGLSGTAQPSRALAIMGSSGAGKTTFLNALSDRLQQNEQCVLTGTRQIGDIPYNRQYRKLLGYVTQEDVISALDTPETALAFSLRVRRGFSKEETDVRVRDTLAELKLTPCKDTFVGIPGMVAGLSGGQRKRCNIGIELINDTKVLLLDEPTSGLDSVTSAMLIANLRDIARRGRTVIYTLHQPTAETLSYFDDLMLMTLGKIAYHGPVSEVVDYFAGIGYTCPDTHTPTDFFMVLLQDDAIAQKLAQSWDDRLSAKLTDAKLTACAPLAVDPSHSATRVFVEEYMARTGSSSWLQLLELTKRSVGQMVRNKIYMFITFAQAVIFGLIAGLIFIRLGSDTTSVQDRYGLLFNFLTNTALNGAITMINTFPRDKAVYIREQAAAAYSPFLYMITKLLSELPIQLLGTLLQCTIIYSLTQLHQDAGSFFYFFAVNALLQQVTGALGFAISASIENYAVASALAPMTIVPTMLAAGLLAHSSRLRPYWYWLEKVAFVRHAFVLLSRREMESVLSISCDSAKFGTTYCNNAPKSGLDSLRQMGIDGPQDAPWAMWLSLVIMFVIFRFIAWLSLVRVARSQM